MRNAFEKLIHDMVYIYSKLLDLNKHEEAKKFLKSTGKLINGEPGLKKLKESLAAFAQEYHLECPTLPPDKQRINEFCKAIAPLSRIPKQYLDSKFRGIEEEDLNQLPINYIADAIFKPNGVTKKEIEVAIQGGIKGIDWNFEQNRLVHGIFYLFDQNNYPNSLKVSRHELYEAIGKESYIDKEGKKRFYEGPNYAVRKWLHKTLISISTKAVPYVYHAITNYTKKGEPLRTLAIDYAPLIKIIEYYKDINKKDAGKIISGKDQQKRLSHFLIQINSNIKGEYRKYFRAVPVTLAKEISEYRISRGERASTYDMALIEYLYYRNQEKIEINYMELAKKLKIKGRDKKRIRKIINRGYQVGIDLNFILSVEIDQPGMFKTKDKIRINPDRFYKPKRDKNGVKANVTRGEG